MQFDFFETLGRNQVFHFRFKAFEEVVLIPNQDDKFLVACYAILHPAISVHQLVGQLVGWLVGPLFTFLPFLGFYGLLILPTRMQLGQPCTRLCLYSQLTFQPRTCDSTPCCVGRQVCRLVGLYHNIFDFQAIFTLLLLPDCQRLYCHVSGLVFFNWRQPEVCRINIFRFMIF